MQPAREEARPPIAHVELRLLPSHPQLREEPALQVDVTSPSFKSLHSTLLRFVRSTPLQTRAFARSTLALLKEQQLPSTISSCTFHVDHAQVVIDDESEHGTKNNVNIHVHAYHLRTSIDRMRGATVTHLPTAYLEASWESLHLRPGVKNMLLSYMRVRRRLNNSAACSGLMLLHGPPGSGKTSTARALAQKGAIRNGGHAMLIHVHSEMLLSKFFAESAQNVGALFERLADLAQKGRQIFVLLDEVESIGLARCTSMNGAEPGDAMRVVNALLQGVDKMAQFGNVIMIATSNLAFGLEQALLDRCDLNVFLAEPQGNARVAVILSAIEELVRCGIVRGADSVTRAAAYDAVANALEKKRGMSGRRLRKMAVAALVEVFQSAIQDDEQEAIAFDRAVEGVIRAVERSARDEVQAKLQLDAQRVQ